MNKLIIHTRSPSFFQHIEAKQDLLDSLLGENIIIEQKEKDISGFSYHKEGTDSDPIFHEIRTPLRLGQLLDMLVTRTDHENASWRQWKEIDMGQYLLFPREMVLKNKKLEHDIIITEKERDMLICLYTAPHHMIEKDKLLEKVWGYGQNIETHTLETHIYRLRQKIEETPSNPTWLVTTDNGYKLNLE